MNNTIDQRIRFLRSLMCYVYIYCVNPECSRSLIFLFYVYGIDAKNEELSIL
jgi:hypothetical protein